MPQEWDRLQALKSGRVSEVQQLFTSAADTKRRIQVGSKPEFWQFPLHIAVKEGSPETVQYLLDLGADPNGVDFQGKAALHLLFEVDQEKDMQLIVQSLIQAGGDVNLRGPQGWTALMWAARIGDPTAVSTLLANGADSTAQNERGETAIDVVKTLDPKAEVAIRLLLSNESKP